MTLHYNCQTTSEQRTTLIYKQWIYKIQNNNLWKTIIFSTKFKLSLTPIPMPNNISVVISTLQNYNDN